MKREQLELVYVPLSCCVEEPQTDEQTDDVAHTDAAFNKDANPKSAAKGVEQEVSAILCD